MIHWHNLASFVCDSTILVFETISGVALLQGNGVSVPERNLHLCSYILLGTHKHNISMCWATILHRINKKALWKPYFLGRGYSSSGSVEQKLSWGFAERRSWPMELLINFCIASFIVLFAFTVYVTWLYFFSLLLLERWPRFHHLLVEQMWQTGTKVITHFVVANPETSLVVLAIPAVEIAVPWRYLERVGISNRWTGVDSILIFMSNLKHPKAMSNPYSLTSFFFQWHYQKPWATVLIYRQHIMTYNDVSIGILGHYCCFLRLRYGFSDGLWPVAGSGECTTWHPQAPRSAGRRQLPFRVPRMGFLDTPFCICLGLDVMAIPWRSGLEKKSRPRQLGKFGVSEGGGGWWDWGRNLLSLQMGFPPSPKGWENCHDGKLQPAQGAFPHARLQHGGLFFAGLQERFSPAGDVREPVGLQVFFEMHRSM